MSNKILLISVQILLTGFPAILQAQEIAQWRGPDRNGIYQETGLMDEWPQNGPQVLWTQSDIGLGFSSAVVMDSIAYVTGKKDSVEFLSALNMEGRVLWQIPYGLTGRRTYQETRVTPTIEGKRIYLVSGRGKVVCIDSDKQEILWSVEALKKYSGVYGIWELAESPLIVEDKIIYTPAGDVTTMVAFDKYTGETVWESESLHDASAYVSPIWFERGGKKIIVNVLSNNIIGVNASNGEIIWTFNYSEINRKHMTQAGGLFVNCISPVYSDGKLFITSGYDHTSILFEISEDGTSISLKWIQPAMDTHHGGVILLDGYIYGSTWIDNSRGNWICLDWETGEVMFESDWKSKGSIISSGDKIILYEEKSGYIALVTPSAVELKLVSSFQHKKGSGPHWAHPSIYEGILFIRHGKTLTAYQIAY
jgi:outer membrane protein assembly factor BamB